MGSSDHVVSKAEEALHLEVSSNTEDGACLTVHDGCSNYREASCSYRWQSKIAARERHKKHFDDNSSRLAQNKQGAAVPASHARAWYAGANDNFPKDPGDWAIDGPSRSPTDPYKDGRGAPVPNGANFTNARWPFWNNAHHLIPKGTLKRHLFKSGPAYDLMRQALLEAKYNVHHKRNMFILPGDMRVAAEVFLPRHLGMLRQSDTFNHPDYNDFVDTELTKIVNDYKEICDKALQDAKGHDLPKATLDKAKLERLSKRCDLLVKLFGATAMGAQLDAMKGWSPG
jgi:hypothetical protein